MQLQKRIFLAFYLVVLHCSSKIMVVQLVPGLICVFCFFSQFLIFGAFRIAFFIFIIFSRCRHPRTSAIRQHKVEDAHAKRDNSNCTTKNPEKIMPPIPRATHGQTMERRLIKNPGKTHSNGGNTCRLRTGACRTNEVRQNGWGFRFEFSWLGKRSKTCNFEATICISKVLKYAFSFPNGS